MSTLYRAIGKSMAARYATYLANLVSLMILSRLFSSEVFGIVAAMQTIVLLFRLVAEGGMSPAIINLDRLEPEDRNGIFGLSLVIGVGLAGVLMILSPALASFYSMSRITQVTPYLAIALFANTATVLPLALLQRQQAFFRMSQVAVVAELGAVAVAFVAHVHLPDVHAYALYFPVRAALGCAGNLYCSRETEFGQPRPGGRFVAIKPLLRTTGFQLGFNFLNYFSRNLDNILVGKTFTASSLGLYDRSYQLMRYPLMLLTFAMTPAIQPALRHVRDHPQAVCAIHRRLAFKLSLLGSVAAIAIYFLAEPIVLVAFGHQWIAVVPLVKLLALIIPVQVVMSTGGSFFQTLERTDLLFVCGLFGALVNISAIVWGVSRGSLESVCWALFVSFHLVFFQVYYAMHKHVFHGGYLKFAISVSPCFLTALTLALFEVLKGG